MPDGVMLFIQSRAWKEGKNVGVLAGVIFVEEIG